MKYSNYFPIYDQLFSKFRHKSITFIEVGVLQGGSLFMWRDFFGENARIIGIDLNPNAKRWEEYGFEIFIGDQSRPEFWREFVKHVDSFDILLDDGGHTNLQQLVTLYEMSNCVNNDGMIVIEDTHSSYEREFGNPGRLSFVNISKRLIDLLHLRFNGYGKSEGNFGNLISVEYFESMVAFKFRTTDNPENSLTLNRGENLMNKDFRYSNHNKVLRFFQDLEKLLSFNYLTVGGSKPYLKLFDILIKNTTAKRILMVTTSPMHRLTQIIIGQFLKFESVMFLFKNKLRK